MCCERGLRDVSGRWIQVECSGEQCWEENEGKLIQRGRNSSKNQNKQVVNLKIVDFIFFNKASCSQHV